MHAWAPYPFLRLSLAWIAGILLARAVPGLQELLSIPLLITLLAGAMILQRLSKGSYYFRSWSPAMGVLLLVLIALTAAWRYSTADESRAAHHLLHKTSILHTEVLVTEAPVLREKSWRMEARVLHTKDSSGWSATRGKFLLYLPLNDSLQPAYGDSYLLRGSPERIPGPANPGEFDYAAYLADQHIYHRYFARPGAVERIDRGQGSSWKAALIALRNHCEQVLDAAVPSPRERAILQALVLGDKSALDPTTRQDYARAGALHILAVSGLHVGIFYSLIILLFGGLQQRRSGAIVLLLISLVAIWGYALLTGLSPSVFRAAVMFSFIALARAVRLQGNIYNTLALSAFMLLLFEPFLLFSVGFQLSYAAVLGIVYLFPKIYGLFSPRWRLLDYGWQISAVSIAAQLATLPLSLYYFGQFPTYFLLSNLLVIPAAFVMLCGGLLVLITSFLPLLSESIGWLLGWIMYGFNEAIALLQHLPGNLLKGLYLESSQSLLLYLGAFSLILLFRRRHFRYVPYAFALFAAALIIQGWNWYQQEQKEQFIIHQHRAGHAFQHIAGHRSQVWADSAVLAGTGLDYQVLAASVAAGAQARITLIDSSNSIPWRYGKVLRMGEKEVLSITQGISATPDSTGMKVDILLLSRHCKTPLADLLSWLQPGLLILDASHTPAFAERRLAEAQALGVPCHSLTLQGAWVGGF